MRRSDWIFVGGAVLFGAGAAVILASLGGGSRGGVYLGLAGIVGAGLCFAVGARRVYTQVDWQRVEAEQQLWEAGPLGRAWLRIRKALARD